MAVKCPCPIRKTVPNTREDEKMRTICSQVGITVDGDAGCPREEEWEWPRE